MRDEGSVGRLLSRAFGVLILLIAGAGLVEMGVVLTQRHVVHELAEEIQPLELANAQIGDVLAGASWAVVSYSLNGDRKMLELYDLTSSKYAEAVRDLRGVDAGRDGGSVAAEIALADSWWVAAEAVRASTPGSAEAATMRTRASGIYQTFSQANERLQAGLKSRSARLHGRSQALGWATIGVVGLITLAVTVIALVTSVRTRRRIVGPLGDVTRVLEGRTTGDRLGRAPVHGPAEIRAVAEALNAAADQSDLVRRHEQQIAARLVALDNAKSDFMSTVSHELRTPLTSISGYVELLRDPETGQMTSAQSRMLEVIGRNARRLRELVEDILTLSRIESGEFHSALDRVDLAEVVSRAVAVAGPVAAKASVGLHCDVRGPLPALGDGAQLDRVLANLLSNAVKFTPPEGTVTIRADRQDDQVALIVADTGMGIPHDEQQALFARFFRATNAISQAIPGTGLGLAIVRTIIDNHGGSIAVESTENVGTTVTVKLPAGTPEQPPAGAPNRLPAGAP
jgi:signal transduction histidine kinase